MPVDKPKRGETREKYLEYCIPAEIEAGKEPEVAAAICYSVYAKDMIMKASGIDKIQAKLKFNHDLRGINLGEGGPCWEGYKQVGMKELGGRQVPNCVKMEAPSITSTYPGQGPITGSK